ncbi:MAG: alpha/beta fold hydrolase [Phycisphaerales bacterium]|nr:alpha/beta fold hydrolase [Phycisphaerales bacterium]
MGLVTLFAAGFAIFWAYLVGLTYRSLTRPARRSFAWCVSRGQPADPGALSPPVPFEERSARLEPGGETPYWAIPGARPDRPAILFCHGWAESRQAVLQRLDALLPHCSTLCAFDLPGHGEAPPGPCRLGLTEHRALLALADEVSPSRPVLVCGYSLGAGVCVRAAAEQPERIAAVIAEAPYRFPWTPARDVMESRGFPHRLNLYPALVLAGLRFVGDPLWRRYDRAAFSARTRAAILILHGIRDTMCPIEDGRAIAYAAPRARIAEIPEAAHGDMWTHPEARATASEAISLFLNDLETRR